MLALVTVALIAIHGLYLFRKQLLVDFVPSPVFTNPLTEPNALARMTQTHESSSLRPLRLNREIGGSKPSKLSPVTGILRIRDILFTATRASSAPGLQPSEIAMLTTSCE
jgi:hypothetical protein